MPHFQDSSWLAFSLGPLCPCSQGQLSGFHTQIVLVSHNKVGCVASLSPEIIYVRSVLAIPERLRRSSPRSQLPRGVNLAVLGLCASLRHLSWESPGARQERGRLKVDVPLLSPRPDIMDSSAFPMPFCSHPGLASAFHCFGSVSASVASAFPSQNRSLSHFISRQQESSA